MKTLTAAVFGVALCLWLTPAAFADSAGLVAAYGFEEPAGTAAVDSSGAGNAGLFNGATRSASGRFGAAASFDGVNDRIDVADSSSLDLSSGMTLEAWVQPTALGWRTAILKERPGGIAYALYASTDNNRPSAEIQAETRAPSAIATNVWTHLASTYDGATLRLYVNGTQVSSRAVTGAITLSSGALRIGGNAVWGEYFKGLVDEVRIYNRALTAGEIQTDKDTAIVSPDTPPTAPALTASVTGGDDVHLSWTPATDDVGVTSYRVYRNGALLATLGAGALSYDIAGEATGTSRYTVRAVDTAGQASPDSNEAIATVSPDTQPPTAPALTVTVSGDDVHLTWTAATDDRGVSRYQVTRRSDAHVVATVDAPALDTYDLDRPDGTYEYEVRAIDEAGNNGPASNLASATVGVPDLEPPTTPILTAGATGRSVHLTWTAATDDKGIREYSVFRDGNLIAVLGAETRDLWDLDVVYGTHRYTVRALDTAGKPSPLSNEAVVDLVDPDVQAPTAPTLAASVLAENDVRLSWGGATDDLGVERYRVFRDGALIATVSAPTAGYDDNDRPGGATYRYTVVAVDGSGHTSPVSNEVAATIAVDAAAPTAPVLTVDLTGGDDAHLTWTAATDDLRVTGYRVLSAEYGSQITSVSGSTLSFDQIDLPAGTRGYVVKATDSSGHLGPASNAVYITVTPDTTPPTTPVLTGTVENGDDIHLSWTAATDDRGTLKEYRIDRLDSWDDDTVGGFTRNFYARDMPGGTYRYEIWAVDRGGNAGPRSNTVTVTIGGADASPPTTPVLTGTLIGDRSVRLTWTPSVDDKGIKEYSIRRNGVLWATASATDTEWTDFGASFNTHRYTITAIDTANKLSSPSNEVAVDVTDFGIPPTAPQLTASKADGNDVKLSWTGATDDVAVRAYNIYRDGTLVGIDVTGTTFTNVNVPVGAHTYTAVAIDHANHYSPSSNAVDVTISPDTTPPTAAITSSWCNGKTVFEDDFYFSGTISDDSGPITWRAEVDGQRTIVGPETSSGNVAVNSRRWPLTAETEGIHVLTLVARDAAGNEAVSPPCQINLQRPDVTVPFVSLADGDTVRGIVDVTIEPRADGVPMDDWPLGSVMVRIDGGTLGYGWEPPWSWKLDTTRLTDGVHVLKAELQWGEYVTPRATSTIQITVDNSPPAPTGVAASVGDDDVNVTWNAVAGATEYRVRRDGQQIATVTGTSYTDADRSPGTYRYTVVAVDGAGRVSPASQEAEATVEGDTTPPSIDLRAACNGATVYDYVDLMPQWSDNEGPVTITIDVDGQKVYGPIERSGASGAFLWQWETGGLANGTHVMTAKIRDGAGNETVGTPCEWNVHNPDVTLPITSHADGDTVSGTVTFTADVLGDGLPLNRENLRLHWDISPVGGPIATSGNSIARPFEFTFGTGMTPDGLYTVTVSATWKDYGAPRATNTIQVRVKNAPPAPTGLRATVRTDDVDLEWDPSAGVSSYNIYRDGTKIGNTSGSAFTDGDRPAGTYRYAVKGQRFNAEGDASNEVTATVDADTTAPSVAITDICDGARLEGNAVSLNLQYSDDRGAVTAWVELDGRQVAGPWSDTGPTTRRVDVPLTGVANGTHTFTALARDAAGNQKVSQPCTYDLQNPPPPPSGLVAAYGFEQTSGTIVTDSSGKGSTGTLSGATWAADGKFGRALSFDGVNDLVTVPDSSVLDLAPGMTLEAWVKPTTGNGWRTVLLKERPGQLAYSLYATGDNGRPLAEIAAGSQRDARGVAALPVGVWTHLAATYDKSTLRLYVNGVQVASTAVTGTLINSTGALRIGGNTVWGEYFSGLIDEVRVYERALSAAEIAADKDRAV